MVQLASLLAAGGHGGHSYYLGLTGRGFGGTFLRRTPCKYFSLRNATAGVTAAPLRRGLGGDVAADTMLSQSYAIVTLSHYKDTGELDPFFS